MTSYLTEEEISLLQVVLHDRSAPFVIQGVSSGFFSIARHYGGAVYKGWKYKYLPATDELIRPDVLKIITKRRKDQAKIKLAESKAKQGCLI